MSAPLRFEPYHETIARLEVELAEARAEVERLRETLEWYADIGNYRDGLPGSFFGRQSLWFRDEGSRARAALEGMK